MVKQLLEDTIRTIKRERLDGHEAPFQPLSVTMWYNPLGKNDIKTTRLVVSRDLSNGQMEVLRDKPRQTVYDKNEFRKLIEDGPPKTAEIMLNLRDKRNYPELLGQLRKMDMKKVQEGIRRRLLDSTTEHYAKRDVTGAVIDIESRQRKLDQPILDGETGEAATDLTFEQWIRQYLNSLTPKMFDEIVLQALEYDGKLNHETATAYAYIMKFNLLGTTNEYTMLTNEGKHLALEGLDNVADHTLLGGPKSSLNPTVIYNRNKISNNALDRLVSSALNAELDMAGYPGKRFDTIDRSRLHSAISVNDKMAGTIPAVLSYELRSDAVGTLNEIRCKYVAPDIKTGATDYTQKPLGEVLLIDALKYDVMHDHATKEGFRASPSEWLANWKIARDLIERDLQAKGFKGNMQEQVAKKLTKLAMDIQEELVYSGDVRSIDFLWPAKLAGIRTEDAGYGISLDEVFGFKPNTFQTIQNTINHHYNILRTPRATIENGSAQGHATDRESVRVAAQ